MAPLICALGTALLALSHLPSALSLQSLPADIVAGDYACPVRRPLTDTASVPASKCAELPQIFHAARALSFEYCLPDGAYKTQHFDTYVSGTQDDADSLLAFPAKDGYENDAYDDDDAENDAYDDAENDAYDAENDAYEGDVLAGSRAPKFAERKSEFLSPTPASECGFKILHRVHDKSGGRDVEGLIAVPDHNDKESWIVLRGSDGHFGDWVLTNFRLAKKSARVGGVEVGRVHKGFLAAWNNLAKNAGVYDTLRKLAARGRKRVVITGHSLGGGVATVAALFVKLTIPGVTVEMITTGAPRVGNKEFVRTFNEHVDSAKRIVSIFACKGNEYSDTVPTIPPSKVTQPFSKDGAVLLQLSAGTQTADESTETDPSDLAATDDDDSEGDDDDDNEDDEDEDDDDDDEDDDDDDNDDNDDNDDDEDDGDDEGDADELLALDAGDRASARWGPLKRVVGLGTALLKRGLFSVFAAVTPYRHVKGLVFLDSRLNIKECNTEAEALTNSFKAHASYGAVILNYVLKDYLNSGSMPEGL